MSKVGFASEKVMRNYLNALLVDDDEPQAVKEPAEAELRPVARLLEKVNVIEQPTPTVSNIDPAVVAKAAPVVEKIRVNKRTPDIEVTTNGQPHRNIVEPPQALVNEKEYRKGDFQALFFDVAGLTVAVPLTELGGIHNMGELNTLIGKPDWFMGVMLHRDNKLSVVNTAKWVMPEKYDIDLESNLEYQYIIMLDNSSWGLACEKLVNTVTLSQDDVQWREHSGRRPWLAGLIKERMCALLDVSEMIELLEKGQSSL